MITPFYPFVNSFEKRTPEGFKKRAEQIGVPYFFKSLTADQIKSQWYGQTAQLIGEVLRSVLDPSRLALFFVDDIDLLLAGDRGGAETNSADRDIMKGLMDFFSGTGTNYLGNYIAVAATNKPTASEEALRQRFVYRAYIGGPTTWEDYTDLIALETRGFRKTGLLDVAEGKYVPLQRALPKSLSDFYGAELRAKYAQRGNTYEDIGRLCAELKGKDPKFTGRSVKNAVQVAKARASDFEIPEEWFINPEEFREKPWDERVAMLKAMHKPLPASTIMMALEYQFGVEHRYRREAEEKRVTDCAQEIKVRFLAGEKVRLNPQDMIASD